MAAVFYNPFLKFAEFFVTHLELVLLYLKWLTHKRMLFERRLIWSTIITLTQLSMIDIEEHIQGNEFFSKINFFVRNALVWCHRHQ